MESSACSCAWDFSLDRVFFFFFQAEDGIRDLYVTGVQTCALPIFGLQLAQARDLIATEMEYIPTQLTGEFGEIDAVLGELQPKYVGFVSARVFAPLELMGTPPIATRYAVGRLTGPDLASTSLLITNAALGEEAVREPSVSAVIAEAADAVPGKPLSGAREEIRHLSGLF